MVTHKVGNLLDSNGNIAHCVSRDLKMSAGVAKQMKARFGGRHEMMSARRVVGDIVVIRRGDRHIIGLITKKYFWNKPSYRDIKRSLINLRKYMINTNQHSISMPRIGCGLDGKSWNVIEKIIDSIFKNDFNVTVYILPQNSHVQG